MRFILLIAICLSVNGEDIKVNSHDGEGMFNLTKEHKIVAETDYDIETLSYNDAMIYKSTTADGSVAVRYSGTNAVFTSTVENAKEKLIIIGSIKGGIKLALRLNDKMKYEPIGKEVIVKYGDMILPHYQKLYIMDK